MCDINKSQINPIPSRECYDDGKKDVMNNDLWKHKSTGMVCSTCMYYVIKADTVGRCRRNAPTMNGYPVVFNNNWCGNHKIDVDKYMILG